VRRHRVLVDRGEREVVEPEVREPRVDDARLDVGTLQGGELAAAGALEVGELDDRDGRVRIATQVPFGSGERGAGGQIDRLRLVLHRVPDAGAADGEHDQHDRQECVLRFLRGCLCHAISSSSSGGLPVVTLILPWANAHR
jgi:hypothetical protein